MDSTSVEGFQMVVQWSEVQVGATGYMSESGQVSSSSCLGPVWSSLGCGRRGAEVGLAFYIG